jgi:uncharacterized protein YeaO (DUF488 family)
MLQVKRVYDPRGNNDGYRILIDRLWPRGMTKERVAADVWLKDIAPSPELREWFAHDPAKIKAFSKRYKQELKHNPAVADLKKAMVRHKKLTLLYAAKDPTVSHAFVLKDFIASL